MEMSLTEFRDRYQELLLGFLWRQWSALGVAGTAQSPDPWIIDPEALLAVTCTMGRFEARLFDEAVDWLHSNGEFLNVQRLKRILKMERFAGKRVLAAVAGLLSQGADARKWKRLAGSLPEGERPIPLFHLKNGLPMPHWGNPDAHFEKYGFLRGRLELRGYSQRFRPIDTTNLIMQLRALIGPNARCEIIAYLLTHESAHPSRVAREAYYYQKTVQDALVAMASSGIVHTRTSGREKLYWLKPQPWAVLLNREDKMPRWVTWPPLFSALERIWLKLSEEKFLKKSDPLLISSELRRLMIDARPDIERAGFATALSDDRLYRGEEYNDVFLSDIRKLLEQQPWKPKY